jgi:hypothetical protein
MELVYYPIFVLGHLVAARFNIVRLSGTAVERLMVCKSGKDREHVGNLYDV